MIYLVTLVLSLIVMIFAFFLGEVAYSSDKQSVQSRLLDSFRRISYALQQIQDRRERVLLFFSLVCSLLSILLFIPYLGLLLPSFSRLSGMTILLTNHFAPLIYLGLLSLLQVSGEISQALTERRNNSSAALILNSFFWLPLILAWISLASYLPVESSNAAKGAVSSMWLVLLQPTGCLAFAIAMVGPYLLINACPIYAVSPIHNWIRELRMVIGVLIIVPLIYGRTCFSLVNVNFTPAETVRLATQILLPFLLIGVVFRLKFFLRQQRELNAERLWKVMLWLSMISVTASFIAFHVLGMSDHLMHVLLNFSLLAIWCGFIASKGNLKRIKTIQNSSG